jgi:hypothetical protein
MRGGGFGKFRDSCEIDSLVLEVGCRALAPKRGAT